MGVSRKLRGEQLDFRFPIRGRPTRIRALERAGQMSLDLQPCTAKVQESLHRKKACEDESFDDALQMTFPVTDPTEDELYREFCRMFPQN